MTMLKVSTLASFLLLGACSSVSLQPAANAKLSPTQGNSVSGLVRFVPQSNAVWVTGEVRGLASNKEHGFHIHEKGDCSSGDGMSAGGHFNPLVTAHGAHDHAEHHAGDLVSLKADANGVARFSYSSPIITVNSGATNVVGRSVIVHRDPDDYKTQPTGNSGARIACGVIGME